MAFRRRRVQPRRTFRRRRQGGGRWGDAGRRAGTVRYRREWTGYYEDPICGGLVSWTPTQSDECWSQQDTWILPTQASLGGDDNESTLMAFRGWFQPWCEVQSEGITGPTLNQLTQFLTGVGFGLQLVPWRGTTPATGSQPRIWDDNDNSDWLVRKWYPYAHFGTVVNGEVSPGVFADIAPMFTSEDMNFDITRRKVDWSEWALWMTIAMSASEAPPSGDAVLFYQVQARLFEQYVGGQSAIG